MNGAKGKLVAELYGALLKAIRELLIAQLGYGVPQPPEVTTALNKVRMAVAAIDDHERSPGMTPAGVTILLIRQAERLQALAKRCRTGRENMLADELEEIRGEVLDAVDVLILAGLRKMA